MSGRTRVAILGSTGSIGCSALSVAELHRDRVEVVGLAAGTNIDRFTEQVELHHPLIVSLASAEALALVSARLSSSACDGCHTSRR